MSLVLQSSSGGSITINEPATASNFTQTLPAGTGTTVVNGVNSAIVHGTAVASTSGTSIDFTSIPSWVKRVTVMFNGVSTNGISPRQVQIGDSGGIETTGYVGAVGTRGAESFYTSAFVISRGISASSTETGHLVLTLVSGNIWVASGVSSSSAGDAPSFFAGNKTLSDTLDRIRITTVNSTDTFDAGSINILYE